MAFLLCNYFILLLIFYFLLLILQRFAGAFSFFVLERIEWRCWCSPLALSLCFYHTEVGVSVRREGGGFGVWSDVKGGNELDSLSCSSCLLLLVYRINREKRGEVGRWSCVFCFVFYTVFFFPQIVSWGRGKWVWGSSFSALVGAWRWFGRRCSSWNREVSWSPPSGFTVCLQAVALAATASSLLHHYVSNETIHRKKKSLTCLFFVYLCQKKWNQISNGCFVFQEYTRSD